MTTHVKVVAALFILSGALGVTAALISSALFGALAVAGLPRFGDFPVGSLVLGLTGLALTIALLVISVPSIICGWGLLTFRRWARILGIVLAVLTLFRFPLGTIFAVYALWVLFQRETETLFAPANNVPAA